jgi:16S rRNA (uracil1498-N3)-methyltransferase
MRASTIRLFVEQPLEQGLDVVCSRAQANYLLNVMRLGDGAQILVFDGTTGEWRASVSRQKRSDCTLHVLDRVRPQEDGPDVHYLFAPVKRARLDFMVQKATELGVAALCPVLTSRTDVQRVKFERMRANVIEAAEQCGVLRIPQVFEPVSFDKLLDGWDPARHIIYCDEEAPVSSPLDALGVLEPGPLAVLIGPEGGFDTGERTRLQELGHVTQISLGPRIMRADTAGVAALSLVNAILGDWR